ncbi:OapC/ArvC family zinc-ribbon domain-containing protein [Methanoculleus bourgensis]
MESIRILAPGSYELNIEKLARSDEVVLGLEKEGRYMVDILSMARKKK